MGRREYIAVPGDVGKKELIAVGRTVAKEDGSTWNGDLDADESYIWPDMRSAKKRLDSMRTRLGSHAVKFIADDGHVAWLLKLDL